MPQLYTNNASAFVANTIAAGDTDTTLNPGDGDRFPAPDGGDANSFSILTIEDITGNFEIVKLTDRIGDILYFERGVEGTTPIAFNPGDRIELRFTAGSLDNFVQVADKQELRGDFIDTDGVRIWHEQDPSTYQFIAIRYYTLDIFGIPVIRIEPAAGITGVRLMAGIVGSDGAERSVQILSSTGSPSPGTDEVTLAVPGQISMSPIGGPAFTGVALYSTFVKDDAATNSYEMVHHPSVATGGLRHIFVTKANLAAAKNVEIRYDGSLAIHSRMVLESEDAVTYPTSLPLKSEYKPRIIAPTTTDTFSHRVYRNGIDTTLPQRAFVQEFQTVAATADPDDVPNEIESGFRRRYINFVDGQVVVFQDPVGGNDLARKSYVDNLVDTSSPPGTDIYGRTILWQGAQSGGTHSLLTGAFSDFNQIQVIGDNGGNASSLKTIDTIWFATGRSTRWTSPFAINNNSLQNGYITWVSDTSFNVSKDNVGTASVTLILGIFPKVIA